MTDRNHGIPGWRAPETEGTGRPAPYARSIGWAILVWVAAVALVYLVAQVFGVPQAGGWLGFAGFVLGFWLGGSRGGIKGPREWIVFVVILSALAFLAAGFGACMYAMALYG